MTMTPQQTALARAALGLPNPRRRSYRNHFVCRPRDPALDDWSEMVAAGFASCRSGSAEAGPATFVLTRAGADRALKPGEFIEPNDFPPIGAH